jgi:peptidoglycan/LPS O-acetylase OafA/YrhL
MPSETEFFNLKTILLFPGHTPVLGVSWSLSYELYFYTIIGIVVYLVKGRFHKLLFIGALIITTVVTCLNLTPLTFKGSIFNFLIGQNLWEFLLGILSGYLFTTKIINSALALKIAVFSFLLILVVSVPFNTPVSYLIYGPLSLALVLSITLYEKRYSLNRKLIPLVKVLGEASYAIYLFGPIVTVVIVPENTLSIIIIILVTIVLSVLFNRLIESKFLKWSRKIIFNSFASAKTNKEC